MTKFINNLARKSLGFICEQYILIFFSLTIGLKLFYFNTFVLKMTWPDNQYMAGIIFGFLSVWLCFLPLFFIKKHKNIFAIILASFLSILLLLDAIYFSYFSALPTIGILNNASQTTDVGPAIADLINFSLLFYIADVIFIILIQKPAKNFIQKIIKKYQLPDRNVKISSAISVVTFTIFMVAISSLNLSLGLDRVNEIIDRGYDTVSTTQYYGLYVAHGIDIARYIKEETTNLSDKEVSDLQKWVKDNKPAQNSSNLNGVAKNKNVILIQVESLGGFAINKKINGKSITPNLDELAKQSYYFPNERFLIGAGHSSDSDMTVNTSYYPMEDLATFIARGRNNYTGMPKNFTANGYSAYAYHGFNRNFWNRDMAMSSLGYQKFYASDNYSNGKKINMGLNDGDFLSETADYIIKQPKPSFSFVITLSSHTPFALEKEDQTLDIDQDDYPKQVGGYLETINYTDRMLGVFFKKLKDAGLYDDSLIIVYGDHVPVLSSFEAGNISYDPDEKIGKETPLIIKTPNQTLGKTYKDKGSHIDIMPTILDLVGIKTNQLMFGQSLFIEDEKALQICSDQLATFKVTNDCSTDLKTIKSMSNKIIKYNQFDNINQ